MKPSEKVQAGGPTSVPTRAAPSDVSAPPGSSGATTSRWYSLRGLTTALTSLLAAGIIAGVLFAVALVNRIGIANDIIDRRFGADLFDRAMNADDYVTATAVVVLVIWVAVAVLTMVWTWRALKNHETLGRYESRWTPGWGIGGWLIPFANLVIPVLIFQDLWRGSDVQVQRRQGERPAGSALVGWWWTAWLVSAFLQRTGFNDADAVDARDLRDSDTLAVIGSIVAIAAAVLFMQVLRRIAQRQELCRTTPTH